MSDKSRARLLMLAVGLLSLALWLEFRPSAPSQAHYQALDAEQTALRLRFNQDAGSPRVLLLVSPT